MKKGAELLKATALGGAVFLVPLVVAGMIVAQVLGAMKAVTKPLEQWISPDSVVEVVLVDLVLLAIVLVICLIAGLAAKSPAGKKIGARLEETLLAAMPGYTFVKGFTDSMSESDESAESMTPVLARFDDNSTLAFEVERTESGNVVVYLPGAPNPWSGSVVLMTPDRVESLEVSMPEAIRNIRQLGRGSLEKA